MGSATATTGLNEKTVNLFPDKTSAISTQLFDQCGNNFACYHRSLFLHQGQGNCRTGPGRLSRGKADAQRGHVDVHLPNLRFVNMVKDTGKTYSPGQEKVCSGWVGRHVPETGIFGQNLPFFV